MNPFFHRRERFISHHANAILFQGKGMKRDETTRFIPFQAVHYCQLVLKYSSLLRTSNIETERFSVMNFQSLSPRHLIFSNFDFFKFNSPIFKELIRRNSTLCRILLRILQQLSLACVRFSGLSYSAFSDFFLHPFTLNSPEFQPSRPL